MLGRLLAMSAGRFGAGLPSGFRLCAAGSQGQLGEKCEQRGYPLHGQGLWGKSAELCR